MLGWVSPRLGIRFEMINNDLKLFKPNGEAFATYRELTERARRAEALVEIERQRAELAEVRARESEQQKQFEQQRADSERQRAREAETKVRESEQQKQFEQQRAEAEQQQAREAEAKAAQLAAKLKELGINPDEL